MKTSKLAMFSSHKSMVKSWIGNWLKKLTEVSTDTSVVAHHIESDESGPNKHMGFCYQVNFGLIEQGLLWR